MRRRRAPVRLVVAVAALATLAANSADAQAGPRSSGTRAVPVGRPPSRPSVPAAAPPVVLPTTRLPAFRVPADPASPSVVSLPVPDELPATARVNFTVTPRLDGAVFGRLTGTLEPAAGASRAILFVARTPRQLAAGDVELALVRFATRVAAVEVPIVSSVATEQDVRIMPGSTLGAARAGAPFVVSYRLSNLGNAPDTVSVAVVAPAGWRVLDPDQGRAIAIPMHGTVDRRVQVASPPGAQGVSTIRLVVMRAGLPVAESRVDVQVLGGAVSTGPAGPSLTLAAAAAAGPWGEVAHVETMQLSGQLTDDLAVSARLSSAPWREGIAAFALSRGGVFVAPPSVQLQAPDWKAGAGVLGMTLTDLTGANLAGQGASLAVTRPGWNLRALAATPDLGLHDASGRLLGGRLEATPGRFSLATTASRLREERGGVRELDAVSLGAGVAGVLGGRWGGEVARRRHDGVAGAGWSATYSRRAPDDQLDVRWVHAPGGSRAFARAASEVAASGSRRLGEGFSLTGSYWRTRDDGTESLTGLGVDGWSLGLHSALGDASHASLTARRSAFGAATAIGDFGTAEGALDLSVDSRRGPLAARVTLSAGELRRTTALGDEPGARFTQEALRVSLRGALTASGNSGAVSLTGQYDRSGAGVGFAPIQWTYGVEVIGAVVPGLGERVRVNAAAERLGGFAAGPQEMTLRAGVELSLPLGASLALAAERNPWIAPGTGAAAWMYVVALNRELRLPRLSSRATRGVVFRDLNGNGRREAGEPGFQGVVLRRGSDVAMTDARGEFSLPGDDRAPFDLDARSLPVGWLAPSTVLEPGTRRIGILAVSPLTVDLVLGEADSVRANVADLSRVMVIARDSTGREWLARRDTRTTAVFDALPPGRYVLEIDASASREPFRAVEDLPPVRVIAGRPLPRLRIAVRARALRFSTPGPGRR